jgi:hypothetical protein
MTKQLDGKVRHHRCCFGCRAGLRKGNAGRGCRSGPDRSRGRPAPVALRGPRSEGAPPRCRPDGRRRSFGMVRILEIAGAPDIFHVNAGAYIGGPVIEGGRDFWDRVLNPNISVSFRSIYAVLPHRVEKKSGEIVMRSSYCGYCAGSLKADLHRLKVRGAGVRHGQATGDAVRRSGRRRLFWAGRHRPPR